VLIGDVLSLDETMLFGDAIVDEVIVLDQVITIRNVAGVGELA
jgi:hypothetical protein